MLKLICFESENFRGNFLSAEPGQSLQKTTAHVEGTSSLAPSFHSLFVYICLPSFFDYLFIYSFIHLFIHSFVVLIYR